MNNTIIVGQDQYSVLNDIYRLRYDVLVTEQGKHPIYANHESKTVKEPLDCKGILLAALNETQIIGTCRINFFDQISDIAYVNHYNFQYFKDQKIKNEIAIISRFVMDKKYRGTKAFRDLVIDIFKQTLLSGKSILIIDCIPIYESFYKKLGFLSFGKPFIHTDGIDIIPMLLDANNKTLLKQIKSIYYDNYPNNFIENHDIKTRILPLIKHNVEIEELSKWIAPHFYQ